MTEPIFGHAAKNSPRHVPAARFRHVFIVTYGRSGSTLLQGVLNAIPGYLIRGENRDLVGALEKAYETFPYYGDEHGVRAKPIWGEVGPSDAWYGYEHFRAEIYFEALRKFLDHLLLHGVDRRRIRAYGFKEVRYEPHNVARKMRFIRSLYPGCAFLLNTRSPEAVVRSEFQKSRSVQWVEQFNAKLLELSAQKDCYLVRYEDVVSLSGTLVGLFEFLGEPFDQQAVRRILGVKHGYHTDANGNAYSNFPYFATITPDLPPVELLVIDQLGRTGNQIEVGGILVPHLTGPHLRFAQVRDPTNGAIYPSSIRHDLKSLWFAEKLKNPRMSMARFHIAVTLNGATSAAIQLTSGATVIRLHHLDQISLLQKPDSKRPPESSSR